MSFLDCKEFHRLFEERVKLGPILLPTPEEYKEFTASKTTIEHHLKICKICSKGEECPAK